jgi:dTDP-4-dehydrorhamnose reductase
MKIIVTGAKGQLGSQLIDIIKKGESELGKINSIYKEAEIIGIDIDELDITNLQEVLDFINKEKVDLIINPAAYTNVDSCENNQELAFKVNSLGARNLAIAAEAIGAKIIHISTDYVFEGKGTIPYKEYDVPNPIGVYGKTKYLGEEFIKQFSSKYFIVRTSWLYGYNGNNFVKTIIKAAKERESLNVVNDQRGNPTNAEDLVYHILKIALTEEYGLYHCTGEGECSWYDFASKIVELSNINCIVYPCSSEEYKRPAKRPEYSSLDNMMLKCTVGNEMRNWEEALSKFIQGVEI